MPGTDPSLDWATTQNNLGNALQVLGERELGTERLEEAVAAFREALKERTRERVPLYWATTQNNLGGALARLGERQTDARLICEALDNHLLAWEVFSRGSPFHASGAMNNVRRDLAFLQEKFKPPTYQECLTRHEGILKRAGLLT